MSDSIGMAAAALSVCALPGCGTAVTQPPGGGRRRLYCSNAHRAEARRLRLAATASTGPADLLSTALDQLARVVDSLRRHQATLQAVDPARHSVELARLRAEATAEVLAAQQIAAQATADASRATDRLAAERGKWDTQRGLLEAEIASARDATVAAEGRAASAQAALRATEVIQRSEAEERDRLAAATAATHQSEINRLTDELNRAQVARAASQARADSADRRAAIAEDAAQASADRAAETEVELHRIAVDVAQAHGTIDLLTARAETAERLLDDAGAELRIERERNDARVAQLNDQITRLASRMAPKRAKPRAAPRRPAAGHEPQSDTQSS